LNYGINISLKIYNKDEYNKLVQMNIPFTTNVQKEGITLWTV